MNTKPILLIDCDDTIENFCEVWINMLNQKYGTSYCVDDLTDWDIGKFFNDVDRKELLSVADTAEFWKRLTPKSGAQSALLILSKMFDVYLVSTGSYESMMYKVNEVLKKYFWFIPYDHILTCSHRWIINADLIIDDKVENIVRGDYDGILFSAPHNKDFELTHTESSHNIYRASNWNDVLHIAFRWLMTHKNS